MTIAADLAGFAGDLMRSPFPLRLIAWDGSEWGDAPGPALVINDRKAIRRLLWRPNELGLAQAYILGELDVIGDLGVALGRMPRAKARVSTQTVVRALPWALRHSILGPPPAAPAMQAKLSGRRHSRSRDKAAIGFHYDLSNEFYKLLLDPHLAYSCAYFDQPGLTLEQAQAAKLELICRKLQLQPGSRLLDVGCGWGSLSLYAARHYGAIVTGVTLSAQQHAFASARAADEGLAGQVTFKLLDYRLIDDGGFDAAATIEMGEHVGAQQYPAFMQKLRSLMAPGGRLLVQQMSRGASAPGGGAFIETYIAPDMHMRPVGQTVDLIEQSGLEVRHVEALREHYVLTAKAWLATLARRWDEAAELVGEPTARIWRLYLAGGAEAFRTGRMGVDQILAVKP